MVAVIENNFSVHRSRHEVYASVDECFIVFVNIALFSVCVALRRIHELKRRLRRHRSGVEKLVCRKLIMYLAVNIKIEILFADL